MDSFTGNGVINLQRGTSNVPYRFQITVASSSNKNDGALPYGSTLHSFTVHCYQRGTTASSTMPILTSSQSSNQMVLNLAWTTSIRQGTYRIEFDIVASITNSTGLMKRQLEFDRLILKERR